MDQHSQQTFISIYTDYWRVDNQDHLGPLFAVSRLVIMPGFFHKQRSTRSLGAMTSGLLCLEQGGVGVFSVLNVL